MLKAKRHWIIMVVAAVWMVSAAATSFAAPKVTFGYVNWPGVTVKTTVAKQILEYLGYEVDMKMLSVPVVFRGLANKDLDLFLGAWLPTMKSISDKYFQDGSIIALAVNLDETIYTLAVPKYVWDAGVKSHADLNQFADRFDHKIIGIEPGNDGNKIVLDMIKHNTYNLQQWKLVEGSAEAMMIAVASAIKKKEYVCWLGWSPHWMNLAYDIKYLDDPENVWGTEPEVVKTVARSDIGEKLPNVAKLFTQFRVTPAIQNTWIDEYSHQKKKPETVAIDWIKNNLGVVDQWLYGVTSVDGKRGRDALRAALQQ